MDGLDPADRYHVGLEVFGVEAIGRGLEHHGEDLLQVASYVPENNQ